MRPPARRHAGIVVLASALAPLAGAPAAHAERAVPAGGAVRAQPAGVSPDGTAVLFGDGRTRETLSTATLGPTGTVGPLRRLGSGDGVDPVLASGADGAQAIVTGIGDQPSLAVRPPGGAFGAPVAAPDLGSVAPAGADYLGGSASTFGVVASKPAEVVRLRADGTTVSRTALPGGPVPSDESSPVRVGADAAGRGVVAWSTGSGAARRTSLTTIAADGTLGPVQVLPGRAGMANADDGVRVAVAPDGNGVVAWRNGSSTAVAPVTTTAGVDLSAATSAPLRGDTIVQPDGSALVATVHGDGRGHSLLNVASRAPGKPFTAVARVSGTDGRAISTALTGGRWVATQADNPRMPQLQTATVVHGVVGGAPSRPVALPVASASDVELAAATPGETPLALVTRKQNVLTARSDGADAGTTLAYRVAGGAPRSARASVRVPRTLRLDHRGRIRLRLRCADACSYRVVADPIALKGLSDGLIDAARTATRVTHRIVVPYVGGSRDSDAPPQRLRSAKRTRLTVAIVDARGGQTIVRRRVTLRP